MSSFSLVDKDVASRLNALGVEELALVVKLASLGLKAEAMKEAISSAAAGGSINVPSGQGAPKPLQIQAYSFVKDRGQYEATYGLTSARAGELSDLLLRDPAAAQKEIADIVRGKLRARNSQREVHVLLTGQPGQAGPPDASSGDDGGAAYLSALVAKDSSIFGCYKFDAEKTGRTGAQFFGVDLGGDLYAFGQSKKVAVAAARLCRKLGRADPAISKYIFYWREGTSPRSCDDIPSGAWSGVLAVGATPPKKKAAVAPTVAFPPKASVSSPDKEK